MAADQGYYADENITVTLIEGGPGVYSAEIVARGEVDFAEDAGDNILATRAKGAPVVAIAAIFRKNPLAFFALADSGITKPADFLGRNVAIDGGQVDLQFYAILKNLGLDPQQVNIVPYHTDFSTLYSGEADVTLGYSTGGLIRLKQDGYAVNLIWPDDYGVHLYADTLVTSDQMIADHPDLVTRFLRATLKGWRTAVENPTLAVETTQHYTDPQYQDLQAEMFDAIIPLVYTGENQIGWMRPEIWEGTYKMMLEQGLLAEPLDPQDAYTLRFLESVYAETP